MVWEHSILSPKLHQHKLVSFHKLIDWDLEDEEVHNQEDQRIVHSLYESPNI